MGIFDFLKNNGKSAKDEQNLAEEIRVKIRDGLRGQFEEPRVSVDDTTATLYGRARSHAAKEKAVLMAGNFKGIEHVDDSNVQVTPQQQAASEGAPATAQTAQFYTIEKGDTLSKIAERHYGDANKWRSLFDANREVIEDPDKIYPGQTIRIPASA